jgi:signal transduction histidine kinase
MATTAEIRDAGRTAKRPAERRSVKVAATILLALVIGLLVFLGRDQAAILTDQSLLLWAMLVFVASAWPVDDHEGAPFLSLDLPILLACAFVTGPFAAGVIALIASVSRQELRGRMSLPRCIYNHSQVALSVIAAGLAYEAVGGDPTSWPRTAIAAEVALAADTGVNYLAVALIYSVGSGARLRSVLQTLHVGAPAYFAAFYAGLGLSAAVMASLYVDAGTIALLALLAVAVLAREALSQSAKATIVERDLEARREALRRVDERIAEERADERARIAGALHDDILQCVFDVTIRAHVIRECYRQGRLLELEDEVPALVNASERIADELRDVIQGLRKSQVGLGGLVGSISLFVTHMRDQTGMRIVADLDSGTRVSERVELAAYQVAREAVANAARHSHADTVWVSVQRSSDGIELRVLDNGCGFDPSARKDKHFGLELMRERVANAGGKFELHTSPGGGVLIVAWFPG